MQHASEKRAGQHTRKHIRKQDVKARRIEKFSQCLNRSQRGSAENHGLSTENSSASQSKEKISRVKRGAKDLKGYKEQGRNKLYSIPPGY